MTDALTNAERLLRAVELMRVAADRVELPKMPEDTTRYDDADCDGFCLADDLRSAADGLAAERERRGKVMMLKVECSHCHHMTNAGLVPLPPATGEAKCADCGCVLDSGTAAVFTVCDACWDKAYPRPTPDPSKAVAQGEKRDEGGMSGAFIVVDKSDGRVMADGDEATMQTICAELLDAFPGREYSVASFASTPPARPTPEPGAAMVEAAVRADDGQTGYERVRVMLRAALAAQEGTP